MPKKRVDEGTNEPVLEPRVISDDAMLGWETQAAQYPKKGPPGISYLRGRVRDDYYVDCLLFRDEGGELVGILNHYPADFPPYEQKGSRNVWVRPDRRGQGIGRELALEGLLRWEPQPVGPFKITEAGTRLRDAFHARYGSPEAYTDEAVKAWRDRIKKEME